MALASLIVGCSDREDDNRGLRAALPFLGQTLIEYQVRQAAAAGARHVVVLVERVPSALVGAVDRLRRDGIAVELARSVSDAADRIHPEERLLLIGDGIIARQEVIDKAGKANAPSIFTVPDASETLRFERIDAGARWAGIAMVDGATLRRTAAMLGDWDLQSTLLRRVVQAEAKRVEAGAGSVWLVDRADEGRQAETLLLSGKGNDFLPGSLSEAITAFLLGRNIKPLWLRTGSIAMAALALPAFANGWIASGTLALALSGPIAAIPRRMDGVALRAAKWNRLWRLGRDVVFAIAAGVLAWRLAKDGAGWGVWALALTTIALMGAVSGQDRLIGRAYMNAPALAGLYLPFAFFGYPTGGLAATALTAFGALLFGQRLLARRLRDGSFPAAEKA
ncbi:hypothetical protein [Sphingomonas cavernae]|uniref:Uncharacterized protein n=1 Tax=Sphingomonas cavernae TaxID=2320861 RepID=A0A418WLU1_9SPHN|nr:hypothetical protein [Sphingomonas cavernae]RJF90969.1 hypothetical protein D3876_12495 [Sphingomonas cavernae]